MTARTRQFDLIVSGAGPAGAAAGFAAARAGLRVALVDKARFPRDKLCGGLFTERARGYHRAIFGEDVGLGGAVTRDEIAFWHAGAELAVLRGIPPLHLMMRRDLDSQLFARAIRAGAADFSGHAVAGVEGTTLHLRDGPALSAPVLIGADGVNSVVARALFGRPFDPATIGFGLEIEVPAATLAPAAQPLRIDFGAAAWGYGWCFPKQAGTTVGIGGLHAPNPGFKALFRDYQDSLGLDPDAIRVKGHYLPFGDFRKRPGAGAVLLAGDAAGLVDPITGEGIAHAMKSGHLAALAAIEALAAGDPGSACDRYRASLREMHRSLSIARALRRIIFAPRWQPTFTGTFRRSGTVRMQYMRLLGGEVEYPALARSVVRRLPRYLLNRLRG